MQTKPRNSLLIFTRNEIDGLKAIFPKIPLNSVDEIIAIDGKSTDGSVEFLQSKGICVITQAKMGRGNAAIEGMSRTSGDVVIFLSSDGNENPADIPELIKAMADADVAVASRFMKGRTTDDSDDPLRIRKCGNRLVTFLVNLIWHAGVTDSTNGLRAVRRTAWDQLGIDSPYHETEFQMTIRAAKLGMRIREIPTVEGERVGGMRYASTRKMAWTFTKSILHEIRIGKNFQQGSIAMKKGVRNHYNQISKVYDRKKRETYLRILRNSIEGYKPKRVIDLGCGSGLALSWLDGERIGVDLSPELIQNAHDGPDYVVADLEITPFKDQSFDLVICIDVAEHLPSLRVVEEAHRILTNEGVFQLSTVDPKYGLLLEVLERLRLKLPEGPHMWRSPKEIMDKMVKSGFNCEQWSKPPLRFYKGLKWVT
ncbi:MAG: methyltransferase domain-containing protein [Candidatus Bathyarchaeia archaeon]